LHKNILIHRLAPFERYVQVTPFGANTNAMNPVNQTRYASCGRVDFKARLTMWLAVGVFGDS
jgi:hypothetical protein